MERFQPEGRQYRQASLVGAGEVELTNLRQVQQYLEYCQDTEKFDDRVHQEGRCPIEEHDCSGQN